ncbi:MAG: chemotaxis protein CheA [Rhodocyclaceae bacterium]|nr:chemotaxis protein CheA [Rhodocyclaceae bacterium]
MSDLNDELVLTYIQESRDQLAELEAGMLMLEEDPADRANLDAIFRAAHTIKGGAGVIECGFIEQFTHHLENLLDQLRGGLLSVTPALASELLRAADHIAALLDLLETGAEQLPEALAAGDAELVRALESHLDSGNDTAGAGAVTPGMGSPDAFESTGGGVVASDGWHISVRFGRDLMRTGNDPLSFIRYLTTLGEVVALETITDALPAADEMDPEACYLGFEVHLRSGASKADIEQVFDFVRDDCSLHILAPRSKIAEYLDLINELPEDTMRLGEMLVRCGALTSAELDAGLEAQRMLEADGEERPPIGEILVAHQAVRPELVEAAAVRQQHVQEKKQQEARLIKVRADKLDQLIDLVGELVIAGASAQLLADRARVPDLKEATSEVSRLVEDIRDSALQLRMVQIGETFSRFNRVVRDVSRELGKTITLQVTGGETELDKSVVERIGDPLMHLIRNAIDHGIEPASERVAAGKPEAGSVGLNAYHDSGSIVIEVSDDGGGLPIERIRERALERGLITSGDALSDKELANLIFEPGFSTKAQVTNLSGRGVGMDVVRRNISALRGEVEVHSEPGMGSRFTIRLPLTLAIIDGFLTGVGSASYVIPLDTVVECIELGQSGQTRDYLNLRGEVLPTIDLRHNFELPGDPPARRSVVVVSNGRAKVGVVVDRLHGEFQTVIKPLGNLFKHLRGISGSTILGSGDVALILDVPALVSTVTRNESAQLVRQ